MLSPLTRRVSTKGAQILIFPKTTACSFPFLKNIYPKDLVPFAEYPHNHDFSTKITRGSPLPKSKSGDSYLSLGFSKFIVSLPHTPLLCLPFQAPSSPLLPHPLQPPQCHLHLLHSLPLHCCSHLLPHCIPARGMIPGH